MAVLGEGNPVFTSIIRWVIEPGGPRNFEKTLMGVIPIFAKQPGFISQHIHRSFDETEFISYQQWQSKQDFDRCMANAEVTAVSHEITELVYNRRIRMDIHTYEIILSQEGQVSVAGASEKPYEASP